MDNKSVLISKIKSWLEIEQQISNLSAQLRELRKQKKELNVDLVDVMKSNEIDCFDCNSGKLMYTKTNVKRSINKKYLHDILSKYYQLFLSPISWSQNNKYFLYLRRVNLNYL